MQRPWLDNFPQLLGKNNHRLVSSVKLPGNDYCSDGRAERFFYRCPRRRLMKKCLSKSRRWQLEKYLRMGHLAPRWASVAPYRFVEDLLP